MITAESAATVGARGRRLLAQLGAGLDRPALLGDATLAWVVMGTVLVVAGALLLFRLGAAEICSSNEAVEALAVQQMVEHGELLAPLLNGRQPMFKPPLFHWTATAIARGLGTHEVTELTVRLPSVAFALGCLLITMLFVRRWLGLTNGLLAGLVLFAAYQFFIEARFGRVDMALTCCEALALFTLLGWLGRGDRDDPVRTTARFADPRLYLGDAALGLGVLAKGPVGAALPLAAVVAVLVGERRWRDLRALASPGPVLTLLAVGSSWYLACLATGRLDVLHRQILDENLSRFAGGIRTMSPFYYLKPLLLNSLPLSLLVPVAVVSAWRAHRARDQRAAGDVRPYALALFWVLTLIFFSIAAYKRRAYLLPLWPPAAALLVWWIHSWRDEARRRAAKECLVATCGVLVLFNLGFAPFAERADCGGAQYRVAASAINGTVPRRAPLFFDAATSESASLLFYLDRPVPVLPDEARDRPEGYVLMPERTWEERAGRGDLRRLTTIRLERHSLILADGAAARRACGEPDAATASGTAAPR